MKSSLKAISRFNRQKMLVAMLLFCSLSPLSNLQAQLSGKWQPLLDAELSKWEVFMGVPHTSVSLPDTIPTFDNVHEGTPLGLNNDPLSVFTVIEEDGEPVLSITGEVYGGLTTLNDYENYHFKTLFKWGEKKWAPRLDALRDNGILYHCNGNHGTFWNVWKHSLEYQVQEDDMGDFISIGDSYADCLSKRLTWDSRDPYFEFDPKGSWRTFQWGKQESGLCAKTGSNEVPNGEWNLLEILVIQDKAIHLVNGEVVNVVKNAMTSVDGLSSKLTSGQIQIQSEGAECYYKAMSIRQINKFPKEYRNYFK